LIKVKGYSLVELTLAVLISAILMLGIDGLLSTALQADQYSRSQNDTLQQARFAMQQMVRTVAGTRRLLIPLGENPATAWSESVRDVLAVTLDPTLDRDDDGWADANNDKDYMDINNDGTKNNGEPERIDEDLPRDNNNDNGVGITGIDDDGDGTIDEGGNIHDDDEDEQQEEDLLDGIDNDGDGSIDEDLARDLNGDGASGVINFDDDFDGSVDEDHQEDDDEDGARSEDWLDTVVFFLNGATLMQRIPNINPADGTDYGEYPIAENVTQLRFERITGNDGQTLLVDITLQISPPDAESVSLNTRIRVGASL
jgi:type II secretory pathway pseudopilin PulG